MKNIEKLLELIKENPKREVVTMVETDVVVSDNYNRWIGSIGDSRLDSYYWSDGCVHFLSDTYELKEDMVENLSGLAKENSHL